MVDHIARMTLKSGYYCTTIYKDAYEFERCCDQCNRQGLISKHQKILMIKILEVELCEVRA